MCSNKGVTKSHQSAGWWWSSTRLPNEERAWDGGPRIISRLSLMCCTDRNLPTTCHMRESTDDVQSSPVQ